MYSFFLFLHSLAASLFFISLISLFLRLSSDDLETVATGTTATGAGEGVDGVLRTARRWALVAAAAWVTVAGEKTVWPF